MKSTASPYDPPRARWHGQALRYWYRLRRRWRLEKLELPRQRLLQIILGVMLPGFAFWAAGRRLAAKVVAGSYLLLLIAGVVFLGGVVASLAFGLLVSLHALSLVSLVEGMIRLRFVDRVCFCLLGFLLVYHVFYGPLQKWTERHLLMPLAVEGRTVIVKTFVSPDSVRRGDWVAYRLGRSSVGAVTLEAGYGLDEVLAVPGDRVRFQPGHFEVNGTPQPRRKLMPEFGEWRVASDRWFIWPRVNRSNHGVNLTTVEQAMRSLARVSTSQFVGQPFKWWFWRNQEPGS